MPQKFQTPQKEIFSVPKPYNKLKPSPNSSFILYSLIKNYRSLTPRPQSATPRKPIEYSSLLKDRIEPDETYNKGLAVPESGPDHEKTIAAKERITSTDNSEAITTVSEIAETLLAESIAFNSSSEKSLQVDVAEVSSKQTETRNESAERASSESQVMDNVTQV